MKVALTSDVCYKGLPKRSASAHTNTTATALASSEVVDFKGWPRLVWLITEHLVSALLSYKQDVKGYITRAYDSWCFAEGMN